MIPRLVLGHCALLVIDLQEKLVPVMSNPAALLQQTGKLIAGCHLLGVPVLVTEQYRKGLGATVPELKDALAKAVCVEEKLKFSACIERIREQLVQRQIRSVLVCGIETHVCVLQTCLDLMQAGFVTAVALDAVDSRRPADREAAVLRMTQAGVIPTTVESALLELVHEAGTDRFKAILPLIR